jgi:hypothetical protein
MLGLATTASIAADTEPAAILLDAAQKGDPQSQLLLGMSYEQGQQGLSVDDEAAFNWYHKAAVRGSVAGQHHVGRLYFLGKGVGQDYLRAYLWLNLSARQGNLEASPLRAAAEAQIPPEQQAEAHGSLTQEYFDRFALIRQDGTLAQNQPEPLEPLTAEEQAKVQKAVDAITSGDPVEVGKALDPTGIAKEVIP